MALKKSKKLKKVLDESEYGNEFEEAPTSKPKRKSSRSKKTEEPTRRRTKRKSTGGSASSILYDLSETVGELQALVNDLANYTMFGIPKPKKKTRRKKAEASDEE